MKPIVILTKNIITEISFQRKIQLLGYEVFCSNQILEMLLQRKNPNSLSIFETVIFSESVSDKEVIQLLEGMPNYIKSFRVDETMPSSERQEMLENYGLHKWLTKEISTNELRETLANILFLNSLVEDEAEELNTTAKKIHTLVLSLSEKEKEVFKLLVSAEGQALSRNELSEQLWDGKVNNCTLTQLSQFIKRIRNKMNQVDIDKTLLQTEWRSGYALSHKIIQSMDSETQTILFAK